MAATVVINRLIGVGPTPTAVDITSGSLQAGTEDVNVSPCTIPVPSSGSNYSYWMVTQLEATAAPDTSLTNIKWYSDGTNSQGTGVTTVVATASTYAGASGIAGSSGCALSIANYGVGLVSAPSPVWQYTSDSSSQLTVAGSIDNSTGSFGYRVVLQMQVESTAGAGTVAEETFVFAWDEA